MIIVPAADYLSVPGVTLRVKVQKVFDGDGFLGAMWHPGRSAWRDGLAFRLAFIDAPEIDQPFGRQSQEFLSNLVEGKSLDLIPVIKGMAAPTLIDAYQRMLCVPLLTELTRPGQIDYFFDGCSGSGGVRYARSITRNIELEMVVNGWAWVVERYLSDNRAEYLKAQQDAQRHYRGLWAASSPEPPWNFKRRQRRINQKQSMQDRLL